MANVLHRISKVYLLSQNTPDFPVSDWVVNPDLSAVAGYASKYWTIAGDTVSLMTPAQRQAVDDQEFTDAAIGEQTSDQIFGDGSDGDIVISANTNLNRDIYPNILTVQAGVALRTNGYRVIARRAILNYGMIVCRGTNAQNQNGGTGGPSGTLGGGGDGATGILNAGVAALNLNTNAAPGYGGAGGDGGSSSGGLIAGGTGGSVFINGSARVRPRRIEAAINGFDFDLAVAGILARYQGGAGGGSGAGLAGLLGAGGGGGGGIVTLCAPRIYLDAGGAISVAGGQGADALGLNGGGGGGGGAGLIFLIRRVQRLRGTVIVSGGNGGNGNGTGTNGQKGGDGKLIVFDVQ